MKTQKPIQTHCGRCKKEFSEYGNDAMSPMFKTIDRTYDIHFVCFECRDLIIKEQELYKIKLENTDITGNLTRSRIDRQKIYGEGNCFICKKSGANVICGRPGSYEAGTAHEVCLKQDGK